MTYLKTALISAATLAIAAPAFAGQKDDKAKSMMKHDAQMTTQADADMHSATTVTTIENRTEVMGAIDEARINDTTGEILQADGDIIAQADQEIIVDTTEMTETEFRVSDDDGQIEDNAIVVPGSNETITTVTCPAGTEAQTNMTCLVTGDFEFTN